MDASGTAMQDGERMCTNPSAVRRAINGPEERFPPPPLWPILAVSATGDNDAAAKMGLGRVAMPCLGAENLTDVGMIPPPPPPPLIAAPAAPPPTMPPPLFINALPATARASGTETSSIVVHSRPLASKRRLDAVWRRYFEMSNDAVVVPLEGARSAVDDRGTSIAMTGCTCELCAKVRIFVAVTFGRDERAAATAAEGWRCWCKCGCPPLPPPVLLLPPPLPPPMKCVRRTFTSKHAGTA
mmetsp:Transcript_6315/g.13913  ORF Transcript_6315/g.13913 Transcript_6315/m.13913 type:complete len:241 (+) Transcript_6315:793-1515(+)